MHFWRGSIVLGALVADLVLAEDNKYFLTLLTLRDSATDWVRMRLFLEQDWQPDRCR